MSEAIIIAIIGLVSAVIGSVITNFFQRKKISGEGNKNNADAAQVIVDAAKDLVAPLKEELSLVRKALNDVSNEKELRMNELEECRETLEDCRTALSKFNDCQETNNT